MGQRLSAAALQVRAELAEMENIYDMDDPPPHEQMRILIEIQRLRADGERQRQEMANKVAFDALQVLALATMAFFLSRK